MPIYTYRKDDLPATSHHLDLEAIKAAVHSHLNFTLRYGKTIFPKSSPPLLNPSFYSFDGGLVTSLDGFEKHAPDYFRRSRRTITFRDRVHLRGGRYIISSNPTFELRQKLSTFREDLDEGLQAINHCRNPFYQLAIADYIKNSIITMLNAFLNEEKIGKYKFNHFDYQTWRQDAQEYGQASVDLFYGTLLQLPTLSNNGLKFLSEKRATFDKIEAYILEEYHRGGFSSRHITRPEASHPLVISAAVLMYISNSDVELDTIIGLPSGSTELAFAHAVGQRSLRKRRCEVLLFPVSLHSAKTDFDSYSVSERALLRWSKHNRRRLHGKNVLVVDDNSSTGNTVQFVSNALQSASPLSLDVAVAEADLVRSKLDLPNKNRSNIASASLYKYAVNVLPVSRTLSAKTDLKELFERKKMLACTKSRYGAEDSNISAYLVGRVYEDLLLHQTESILAEKEEHEVIRDFRKTFLSNFYPVDVIYDHKQFVSVEHGYQAMKFAPGVWDKITEEDLDYINRRLHRRSAHIKMEELPDMFTLPQITAGTSKIAANCLRIRGYVREDWDNVKTIIMANLLVQKFATPDLWNLLLSTGDKYLIEGNDWNDTYWGECNGRGRNVLGRMLMVIRSMSFEKISSEALRLQKEHSPEHASD